MPVGVDQDGAALADIQAQHPHFPKWRTLVQNDQSRGIERQAGQHDAPVARTEQAAERQQAARELSGPDRHPGDTHPVQPLQVAEQCRKCRIRTGPAEVRQRRHQDRRDQAQQHQRNDHHGHPGDGIQVGETRHGRNLSRDACHERRHAQHHDPLRPCKPRQPAVGRRTARKPAEQQADRPERQPESGAERSQWLRQENGNRCQCQPAARGHGTARCIGQYATTCHDPGANGRYAGTGQPDEARHRAQRHSGGHPAHRHPGQRPGYESGNTASRNHAERRHEPHVQSGYDQQMHRAGAAQQRPVLVAKMPPVAGRQRQQVRPVAKALHAVRDRPVNPVEQGRIGVADALAVPHIPGAVHTVGHQPALVIETARILISPGDTDFGGQAPGFPGLYGRGGVPVQAQPAPGQVGALAFPVAEDADIEAQPLPGPVSRGEIHAPDMHCQIACSLRHAMRQPLGQCPFLFQSERNHCR